MGGVRVFLLIALLLAPSVLGVGIGVNKARLTYADVLQNGYAQDVILVTTDSDTPIAGTYEFEGELAPWMRLEPADENFTFDRQNPYAIKIIVEPPADAQLRSYTGGLRLLTGDVSRTEGGRMGTATRAAFLIRVSLGVTGTQRLDCQIGGVALRHTEIEQPIDFIASIQNNGNVRVEPDFTITVFDQYQTQTIETFSLQPDLTVLPTETGEATYRIDHDLDVGQYWARVDSELCGGGGIVTFDILERGGIADSGELVRIDVSPWAHTGDIIPINAVFQNTGSRVVGAKFTGTITRQDSERIFKVIDTNPINVRPQQTVNLETFFNPTEPGRYIVAGRVIYNQKLTYQKSSIINVNGPILEAVSRWTLPFFLIIVVLIILIMIKKKKARRR